MWDLTSTVSPDAKWEVEERFWRALRAVFENAMLHRLPRARENSQYVLEVSAALCVLPDTSYSWARLEVDVPGAGRTITIHPVAALRQVGIAGPIRLTPRGHIDRELVPDGDDLPAKVYGWSGPDVAAVWDVYPADGATPLRLNHLTLLCADLPDEPIVRYRLLATLHHPLIGQRSASFGGEVSASETADIEGVVMEDDSHTHGLVESLTIVSAHDSSATALAHLDADDHRYAVVTNGRDILGVLDEELLRNAPPDSPVLELPVWPVAVASSDAAVRDIADAVRERGRTAQPRGVVLLDHGEPTGFVPAGRVAALGSSSRHAQIGVMAGAPVSTLTFECAVHDEATTIAYYDPAHPPRCSHGDLMRRKR
ncbi:hypothetical protein [Mycolicibacterium llatzerense]|uniref:hypothetical protein n=1 Tax=Mycolicibacterium llatzerense TaxID=280871 RepID=UPI0008DD2E8D|nr:hypothetical protein [Mycolicibacterium llatzerense]